MAQPILERGSALVPASRSEPRCAELRAAHSQPLAGTAPTGIGWLLVTDPGPWAAKAFEGHRDEPGPGMRIAERAAAMGLRPLLIRRHGRHVNQRRFAVVDSTTGRVGWRDATSLSEMADAPWLPARPMAEPVYLVCTHGARDACCAIDGRPVAAALNALRPDATWECSHVGGHRFAANVVVLPHGLVYGAVTAEDAALLVAATEAGRFVPRLLRGRITDPAPVQTARVTAAQVTGHDGIDDFAVGVVSDRGDRWLVEFVGPSGPVTVEVAARTGDVVASCGKAAVSERYWVADPGAGAVTSGSII